MNPLKILFSFYLLFTFAIVKAQKVDLPNKKFSFSIDEVSSNKYEVSLILNEIQFDNVIIKSNSYTRLGIDGFFPNQENGFPELIKFNQLFEIPISGDVEVNIISKKSTIIDLNLMNLSKILPHQRSISKGEDASNIPFQKNSKVYSKNRFINYQLARVVKKSIFRKHQLSNLEICPFEYNPVLNQLKIHHNLKFEIIFKNGSLENDRILNKQYNQREFSTILNNTINYPSNSNQRDYITSYPTTYVIVSDRSFEQELQPLVNWKTKMGFQVIEAYTDQPLVGNTTSSIKTYLADLYNNPVNGNPPSYILIVGDVADIPSFSGIYGSHVSDLYYAEYDGNGDIYADVYYGRFSSSDPLEIQNMVNKSVNYEMYNFQDPSFLSDVVMISGVDATWAPTYGNGQINYANQYYTNSSNGINSNTFLYPASGSSSSQILQLINSGCSFANYTAHGYGQGWADPAFTCTDVHAMTNIGKPAMMIGNCCLSNKFDDPECFGEALLRVDNKGAIGYIGGSNNTYWNEDYWWAVGAGSISANPVYDSNNLGFFDKLFHQNGEASLDWYTTNSQIMMGGNLAVTQAGGSDAYYCEIYHLMGDPSIMTYFGSPSALSVQHDQVVPLGLPSIDINTEDGAYVALSQNGIYIDAGLVSNGTVSLDISTTLSLDSIEVVVTKQNKIPYFGSIQIMPANGVYLSNSTNDFIEISGNSNGEIDFNETIEIDATIKNYGNISANGVFALLSSSSNYVTILQDSSYWGSLLAGIGSQNSGAFKFKVDGAVPDQEVIIFQLNIFDDQGSNWNTFFQIKPNAPNSNAVEVLVDDHQFGNNNNRLDPGEILSIYIPTKNSGHADNIQLVGDISCNSSEIQFISDSFNLGSLPVAQQVDAVFNLVIDSSFNPGSIVTFIYTLTDGAYVNQYEFELVVGLTVEDFSKGIISTTGWTNNSSFPWVIDSLEYYNDSYSLRSNNNGDQTSSILELEIDVLIPSDLSFMKKVSSESNYDFLRFYIDQVEVDSWSGEVDWSLNSYPIDTGLHSFKWIYEKDFSVSSGLDAGWLDEIIFPVAQSINVSSTQISNELLSVYPNPSSSELFISFKNTSLQSIDLYDIFGKNIFSIAKFNNNNNLVSIPVNRFAEGTYLLHLTTSSGYLTKRIVIVK